MSAPVDHLPLRRAFVDKATILEKRAPLVPERVFPARPLVEAREDRHTKSKSSTS